MKPVLKNNISVMLEEKLNEIIKNSNEHISMIVKKLNDKENLYYLNGDYKVVAASVIKIPIMLAVLNKVMHKEFKLSDKLLVSNEDILCDTEVFEYSEDYYTLEELISWMIIVSDNTATNVLIKHFGMEYINSYIHDVLNLNNTYLQRYMLDKEAISSGLNNYTSAEDIEHIFKLLFNKEILNNNLCDLAIRILYNQKNHKKILRYIYFPVLFAHKSGSLDYINHDAGVININDNLYYIGIFIYNSKFKDGNRKLMGLLGKTVIDYLLKL